MSSRATSYGSLYASGLNLASTTFITGISWGIMTSFCAVCIYSLVCNIRSPKKANPRRDIVFTCWITVVWILSSLSTIANAYISIDAYTRQTNYPGGPVAYMADIWSLPIPMLAVVAYGLVAWFADALVLWRLVVFCRGVHPVARGLLLSFAFLIYIGMIGTSCFGWAIASSNQTLYSKLGMKSVIPAAVLSAALTVFVAATISIRLLLFRRWMRRTLGHEEVQTSPYTSIAAMIIEPAALFAVWSIVFVVLYAIDNPWKYVMDMTMCDVEVLCPVMIIYRVSKGLDWEKRTPTTLQLATHMSFAERSSDTLPEPSDIPGHQGGKSLDVVSP